MPEKEKKNNIWQTVITILFVFLSVYFVVSVKNSNTSYKDEIDELEQMQDSLETRLQNSVSKDFIIHYLEEQDKLEELIVDLNEEVDSLKEIEHETIDFSRLSVDSNIVNLTKYLSEQD